MKVLIGVPVNPSFGISPLVVQRIRQEIAILMSTGIQVEDLYMTTPSIETARQSIVDYALNNNFDYLVFLDSDILLKPGAILMSIMQRAPVVCCPYMGRKGLITAYYIVRRSDGSYDQVPLTRDQLRPRTPTFVDACALGACIFETSIFKKMKPPHFLFVMNERGQYISEDIYFFIRLKNELGLQPMLMPPEVCETIHLISPTVGIDLDGKLIYFSI
jgi:hypothetical protein